jgi:hypothetical protein
VWNGLAKNFEKTFLNAMTGSRFGLDFTSALEVT